MGNNKVSTCLFIQFISKFVLFHRYTCIKDVFTSCTCNQIVPEKIVFVNEVGRERATEGNTFFGSVVLQNGGQRQLDHILAKGFDDADCPSKILKYLEENSPRDMFASRDIQKTYELYGAVRTTLNNV